MASRSRSPPPVAYHSTPPPPPRRGSGSHSPMDRSPRPGSRSPVRRGSSPPRRNSRSPPRSPGRKEDPNSASTTLYISGLHPKTRESDLERKFSKFGKILNIKLVTDPRTRDSRGFGFIGLETADQATACITNLNGAEMDGRKITVEKAKRERSRSPTPGKYLGSDRLRRAINSRPLPPPVYSSYPYRTSGYRPYPPPPMPYGGYPPYPTRGYPDRYSPERRRDRSPIRSPPRRYSPPPYRAGRESPIRGRERGGERDYYSRDMHRGRSRSREREYR